MMSEGRDAFDELRALVHRGALEQRGELRAITGDAQSTMRLLKLLLDLLDSAIADLRKQHGHLQPSVEALASSTGADLNHVTSGASAALELDSERRSRVEAILAQLDAITGPERWRTLVHSVATLHQTLTTDLDHVRADDATEAWVEGLECFAEARTLCEEIGTGESSRSRRDAFEQTSEDSADEDLDDDALRAIDRSQSDAEEIWRRGIAREGASTTLAHSRELKYQRSLEKGSLPGDTLREPPSPKVGVRHLTCDELIRVQEIARRCVGQYHESMVALFIAEVLPRFKDAAANQQTRVPMWRQDWQSAAAASGAAASEGESLLTATNLFVRVKEQGTYAGEWFAAEWALRDGVFAFDDKAPKKPLYLRSAKFERKWRSFQAAVAGRDGRATK